MLICVAKYKENKEVTYKHTYTHIYTV